MTDEATEGPIEIDATLVLAESIFLTMSALLQVVPLQADPHNLEHQKVLGMIQTGMNQIGALLVAMGSSLVAAKPEEQQGGGTPNIILPR